MRVLQTALIAGIMLTALLLFYEVRSWRRGTSMTVSPRQRAIRALSGITLLALLGLTLAGSVLGILFTPDTRPVPPDQRMLVLVYGSICVAIACALVFLALLDMRETLRSYREERRRIRSELGKKDGHDQ